MDYNDQTIIKPRPGRSSRPTPIKPTVSDQTVIRPRKRPGTSNIPAQPPEDATVITARKQALKKAPFVFANNDDLIRPTTSPLLSIAATILALPSQLRQITGQIDVQLLHTHVKQQLQLFENESIKACNDTQIRTDASYVLCALIDETVLNTPWGENSAWSQNPMLSTFHHETYGGERVYDVLNQALQTPSRYEDILEIIYLALSLGFMGKLRVEAQGAIKIEQYRTQIYEVLTHSRDALEPRLSPQCQPLTGLSSRLQTFLPYWILTALLVLIAFGCYSYWLFELNKQSDQTRQLLSNIIPNKTATPIDLEAAPSDVSALQSLLADEISRGVIAVDSFTTHTSLTLQDQGVFPSASAEINVAFMPVLDKIGKALEAVEGNIIISGHTDNQAIRTTKYPSNWHLSLARASSVVKYLDNIAALQSRLLPEGKGSEQPVADNATAEGRALNRRVVIDIFYPRVVTEKDAS